MMLPCSVSGFDIQLCYLHAPTCTHSRSAVLIFGGMHRVGHIQYFDSRKASLDFLMLLLLIGP